MLRLFLHTAKAVYIHSKYSKYKYTLLCEMLTCSSNYVIISDGCVCGFFFVLHMERMNYNIVNDVILHRVILRL